MVWVPGYMAIDELDGQGSSHPLTGYESVLGVSAKVAGGGGSGNGQVGKMRSTGSSYMGKRKLRASLKNLSKKSWRTAPPEHKQRIILRRLSTGHCY